MTNTTIAQAIIVTGRRYGAVPSCIGCHHPINTQDDYWALLDGPPCRRPALLAAAHCERWDDHLDDYDHRCPDTLRHAWHNALAAAQVTTLRLGADGGGPRFYAYNEALHAGTALDVLNADGTWLTGRFEYDTRTQPWMPCLYIPIAGWDQPVVPLQLTEDAIVRIPTS